jgi:hypothetical protein
MIQNEIVAYLTSLGYENVVSYERDEPSEIVIIRPYDAPNGDWHDKDGLTFDEVEFFQVKVRGLADADTETKARAIHSVLHCRHKVIEGRHFHYMQCLQRPTPLGRDDSDRPIYVFNVECKHSRAGGVEFDSFTDGTLFTDDTGMI